MKQRLRLRRLLVPNRGEIALRIVRTARALGLETVVAHSAADAASLAVALADSAVLLGPAEADRSYLSAERIVDAARRTGCDAVHPGYGFLSEREELALAVEGAGLVYVGPTVENIRLLGDKLSARRHLSAEGIPVVPGEDTRLDDPAALRAAARRVGYPLLLKAAEGGGGKGIRLVRSDADLDQAFRLASGEAKGAFGGGTIFAERYLTGARHIEVQVLGDGHGGVRVFTERDCSLQRRYQKLVEETPSPAVDPPTRERLLLAAAKVATMARYRGAGTVEFLLDADGRFYFLEVNTRLQVEHPITEEVTGVDLVAEQFAIAEGRTFPGSGPELTEARGAAIEFRVNAEDPQAGFRPGTGRVAVARIPAGPGIRVDSALFAGLEVTPHYDPLLAKVIAWGADRGQALQRLGGACREMHVGGIATTLPLATALLEEPGFLSGSYHTQRLEELLGDPTFLSGKLPDGEERDRLAVVAAVLRSLSGGARPGARAGRSNEARSGSPPGADPSLSPLSPWVRIGRTLGLRTGERPSRSRDPGAPP